jgi:hypothetical protein
MSSPRVLANVGSTPVPVTAGATGYGVSIQPAPGQSATLQFKVYDQNQNLITTVINQYSWTTGATGDPYFGGQVVGYVALAAGTANFIVQDTNPSLYPSPQTVGVFPAAGAITIKSGRAFLTGATAQAYTLALPVPGVDDGKQLEIVNQSGQAHTVTTPALAINGASDTATFAATVGAALVLRAYQGGWYFAAATGNGITLSEV